MLSFLRRSRQRMWRGQIIIGDIIALLNGGITGFIHRWIRKKFHKWAGNAVPKIGV